MRFSCRWAASRPLLPTEVNRLALFHSIGRIPLPRPAWLRGAIGVQPDPVRLAAPGRSDQLSGQAVAGAFSRRARAFGAGQGGRLRAHPGTRFDHSARRGRSGRRSRPGVHLHRDPPEGSAGHSGRVVRRTLRDRPRPRRTRPGERRCGPSRSPIWSRMSTRTTAPARWPASARGCPRRTPEAPGPRRPPAAPRDPGAGIPLSPASSGTPLQLSVGSAAGRESCSCRVTAAV